MEFVREVRFFFGSGRSSIEVGVARIFRIGNVIMI